MILSKSRELTVSDIRRFNKKYIITEERMSKTFVYTSEKINFLLIE